eukprot:gene54536-72877_t
MSGLFLIEQALNGLQLGLMLFLLAAGLTLVFGIMDVLNLAHGSLFMAGAYVAAEAHTRTGSFAAAIVIAVAHQLPVQPEHVQVGHRFAHGKGGLVHIQWASEQDRQRIVRAVWPLDAGGQQL